MQPLASKVLPLQLSNVFSWVMSFFYREPETFLCANPLITKYNMVPPEDPKTRIHNGYLQIELLRGDRGRSVWRDVPGQLYEAAEDPLQNEK